MRGRRRRAVQSMSCGMGFAVLLTARCRFIDFANAIEQDGRTIGEFDEQIEFTAHGLDIPPECREQKVGALDQAAPLQGWDLPDAFATLHRLLEARMGKAGKREYVQVLRLLETFEMGHVHGAIRQALDLGAIGYDAVKHLILCRIERRPPRLDLDIYPYLPKAVVETTKPASYAVLLSGTAA